jgi:hypothetical protein
MVNEMNVAPILTVPSDQTLDELTALSVSASATDADLPTNALTFSLVSPPSGMSINPTNGLITWTPDETQGPSSNLVTVVVTDTNEFAVNNQSFIVTNTFSVVVSEVNAAPLLFFPTNLVVHDELATMTLNAIGVDSDDPTNALTFSLISPPAGMTIDPANGLITWTPDEGQGPSSNVITVVVTDTNSLAATNNSISTTNTFVVLVNEVNVAPILTVPTNQVIDELATLSVSVSATDADLPANTLTFSLVSPPSGMTIDATNGLITWTPTEAQGPGSNLVTVVVTDTNEFAINSNALSATNTFVVIVNELNVAPVLSVPTNQIINELAALSVSASATDADEPTNVLTFSLVSPPAGMTINPSTGLISWTPTEGQGPSSNWVTVVVTDTNETAINTQSFGVTNAFAVVVNELNSAPVLTVPTNQTINELTTLNVSASANDVDDPTNSLTFSLVSPPDGMTIDPVTGSISWTPGENQGPSSNVVTIVVTDTNSLAVNSQSLSTTNTFVVIVNEVNMAPILTPPSDRVIHAGMTLSATATATDADLPTNTLTFALVSGPGGLTVNPAGLIQWPTTDANADSTNVVAVRVFDNGSPSLSATNTFTVTVLARPLILPPLLSGTNLFLAWTSIPGASYRLQFNPNLALTNWFNIPGDVTASSNVASHPDPLTGSNRFFRVLVLP